MTQDDDTHYNNTKGETLRKEIIHTIMILRTQCRCAGHHMILASAMF